MNTPHTCIPNEMLAALIAEPETLPTGEANTKTTLSEGTHATHIFTGRIVTMDETLPLAEALAIRHHKIVAVGAKDEVMKYSGPLTKHIDLGDQVMYPGLIEPHMHLWVTAINYDWVDCSAITNDSIDAIKDKIAAAAKKAKPGEWVLGKLFDPSLLPGEPSLTTKDLDPLAPDNPVFIMNASMHFGYVNSKALETAGVTNDIKDPQDGTYGRDESGKLNGILGEMGAIVPVMKHITSIKPAQIITNIHKVTEDAAQVGVTTMREAATGALLGPKEISLLHALHDLGRLKTRLSLALVDDKAQTWPESKHTAYGAGNDFVWVGARKIVTDGSNQGRSGYLEKPYLDSTDRGKADITPAELEKRIRWCHENGWQIMTHANGDAAIEIAVDIYHKLLANTPHDQRHRIEHCSLVPSDDLFAKMAQAGVSPSFLINHVYYWGEALRDTIIGKERIKMLDRTAAAVQAGLKFTLHSDYNVSPINPLHYVKVAATRTTYQHNQTIEPSQKVSVYQALKAITIDAAWQIHAEDRLGSLVPGKFADLVVLSADPQQVTARTIDTIEIKQTWLGGKLTFEATKRK